MENISEQLKKIVDEANIKLSTITRSDWSYRSAPNKWTKKEILGHLIDSATHNHHRFVRLQYEEKPTIKYDQNNWVVAQDYNNAPTDDLVNLWRSYNKHLAYLISIIPNDKYGKLCDVGKEQPFTLEFIITDYIRHLKHHLSQIIGE